LIVAVAATATATATTTTTILIFICSKMQQTNETIGYRMKERKKERKILRTKNTDKTNINK